MSSTKHLGNEGEKFVADYLSSLKYIVEIHPRTSRPVVKKDGSPVFVNGRPLRISADNDYHNNFDLKAERIDGMIYVQSKVEPAKNNVSQAQKNIDHDYPHQFPYQRIQTWQLWKEWVKPEKGRRQKEFRFRIQERHGFGSKTWKMDGETFPKGNWVEIDPSGLVLESEV